jgi:hypothetical protein
MLEVPTELVTFVADLLAAERERRGTRAGTRALTCEKQAVLVLVWFREGRPVALTGHGLGISQATAYRYLDEALDVLDAQAPDLHEALQRGHNEGWSHVILDGKVVDTAGCGSRPPARRARPSTPGTRARPGISAATSRHSWAPVGSRSGSPTSSLAPPTT